MSYSYRLVVSLLHLNGILMEKKIVLEEPVICYADTICEERSDLDIQPISTAECCASGLSYTRLGFEDLGACTLCPIGKFYN